VSIDPRAVVSPDAQVAAGVHIGPYAVIGPQVSIGPGCWIGPHAVINGPTVLGADNKVFQFASIGEAPQDRKYNGEPTRLVVGDRNVFRECVTVNRGTVTGIGETRIGNDNLLLAYTHVAHDCVLGNHIVLSNTVNLAGHVELGDWVIMGGFAGAHQFCKVGAHAFIGNNTSVIRDIPNAYKVLYRSELKLEDAVTQLRAMVAEQDCLGIFVDFISQSTRSLAR
jgi:UDP-N-acetylglucosamine acyltransferase